MASSDRTNNEPRSRQVTRQRSGSELDRRRGYEPAIYSSPLSMMRRMHEEMDRVFSDLFGTGSSGSAFGGGLSTWMPAVEVSERDNQMNICAELPGLKPEEVKVEVTDDAIVIEGERKDETEGKEGGRWHSERRYGQFYRAIPLPDGADADQIRAEFRNGELHVTVPVQQSQSKRRQIPVKGAATEGQHER
jgi:HSP20 family protein